MKYKHLDDAHWVSMTDKMEEHQRSKNLPREQKAKLKEQAKADNQMNVACIDLPNCSTEDNDPHTIWLCMMLAQKMASVTCGIKVTASMVPMMLPAVYGITLLIQVKNLKTSFTFYGQLWWSK